MMSFSSAIRGLLFSFWDLEKTVFIRSMLICYFCGVMSFENVIFTFQTNVHLFDLVC